MDNFIRTVTLSEVDIEDLIEAIDARLNAEWVHDSRDEAIVDHAKNLFSLRERLTAVLNNG